MLARVQLLIFACTDLHRHRLSPPRTLVCASRRATTFPGCAEPGRGESADNGLSGDFSCRFSCRSSPHHADEPCTCRMQTTILGSNGALYKSGACLVAPRCLCHTLAACMRSTSPSCHALCDRPDGMRGAVLHRCLLLPHRVARHHAGVSTAALGAERVAQGYCGLLPQWLHDELSMFRDPALCCMQARVWC